MVVPLVGLASCASGKGFGEKLVWWGSSNQFLEGHDAAQAHFQRKDMNNLDGAALCISDLSPTLVIAYHKEVCPPSYLGIYNTPVACNYPLQGCLPRIKIISFFQVRESAR